MSSLPIYFRVSNLSADEHSHTATIHECRRPVLATNLNQQRAAPIPSPSPVVLCIEVDPTTFSTLRIGQEFELADNGAIGVQKFGGLGQEKHLGQAVMERR